MDAVAEGPESISSRRRFVLRGAAIVALALGIRVLYVWMATAEYPIRGDVNQYVLYAWNMSHRGTFSTALPNDTLTPPDSYRGPGYPAFLATSMMLAGHSDLPLRLGPGGTSALGYATDTWMQIALRLQVLLGTATVWLVIVLGRFWLGRGWSLSAGLMTALWPHLVAFTGVLLSETFFAFALMLGLWLLCSANDAVSRKRMLAGGIVWGMAYLINPVAALFPLMGGALVLLRGQRKLAMVFLASFALAPGLWAIRNALSVHDSGTLQRMEENFVQGSWPEFLVAFNTRHDNDISRQIVEAVNAEGQQLRESPTKGLANIEERIAQDPLYYFSWYLWRKPYLLWDWSIRVGTGDIYFLPVQHSPYDKIPLLSVLNSAFRWVNPLVFALAVASLVSILWFSVWRGRRENFALLMTCLLVLYVTAVHVALQAEPRYSIPYRPEEILLAVTALAWLTAQMGFWTKTIK